MPRQGGTRAGCKLSGGSTSDGLAKQIPLGILADRIGGIPVMQSSLLLWTAVTGATSLIRRLPQPQRFPALLIARAALGLAQSCIMPATSAMAAK